MDSSLPSANSASEIPDLRDKAIGVIGTLSAVITTGKDPEVSVETQVPESLDPSWEWPTISVTSVMGLGREPKFPPRTVDGLHMSSDPGLVGPWVGVSSGEITTESPESPTWPLRLGVKL